MCVVSMVGDHYSDKFQNPTYNWPVTNSLPGMTLNVGASKEEVEALRKEVREMKALLVRAKLYDEQNNEPNCEMESKVALLKKIAELVGVDLSEVFGSTK